MRIYVRNSHGGSFRQMPKQYEARYVFVLARDLLNFSLYLFLKSSLLSHHLERNYVFMCNDRKIRFEMNALTIIIDEFDANTYTHTNTQNPFIKRVK